MENYNLTLGDYENPQITLNHNLGYLYSIPYDNITLSLEDKDFTLKPLIVLRWKKPLYKTFWTKPTFCPTETIKH